MQRALCARLERLALWLVELNRSPAAVESFSDQFYPGRVKAIFGLAIVVLTVVGCRGPGGPMERAGRTVDDAVYDVGTGIKKAGQEVQEATR
jgi:hypothetical protein